MRRIGQLLCLGWISGLLACQEYVEVDMAPQPPRLAVYGILQPDSLITVWVTATKSIQDDLPVNAVNQATVRITPEGQSPQTLTRRRAEEGQCRADFRPEVGVTYHLSVTADGYPSVEATTRMPPPVVVQQTNYVAQRIPYPDECGGCPDSVTNYEFALIFEDPASEENYYEVTGWMDCLDEYRFYDTVAQEVAVVQTALTQPLNLRSTDPVISTMEETVADLEPDRYYYDDLRFTDRLFNGDRYVFDFRTVNNETPTRIKVAFRSYHAEAYRYERAKEAQRAYLYDVLFYEPVQLPTNIRGGYGIFSSFSQDTVVIELN